MRVAVHIGIMYDTGEESHIVWTCGQVEGYPSKRHLAVCMVTLRGKIMRKPSRIIKGAF